MERTAAKLRMTYDYIIFNSNPSRTQKIRSVGPHRIANEIRQLGKSCLVVDYIDYITVGDYKEILKKSLGSNTKAVGFSVGWILLLDSDDRDTNKLDSTASSELKFHERNQQKMIGDDRLLGRMVADNFFEELVNYAKSLYPIKVFIGGPKALVFTEEAAPYLDYVFHGYSENMIKDLVNDMDNCPRNMNYDFKSQIGDFDFKQSATYYEKNAHITSSEILQIELSRGCKFKCKFCNFPMIGDKHAAANIKDPEVFKDELIKNYEMFGVTKYSISDDTFNDSIEKVEVFAKAVRDLPFKPKFWAYIRADLLVTEPDQIPLLHEMGLAECWMGIETFTHKAGRAIGKGMHPDRIKQMLYDAKSVWGRDVMTQSGFIIGLPYESSYEFEENTIEFLKLKDCPLDRVGFNALHIVPPVYINTYDILYLSEFDKNFEKYGYYFPEQNVAGRENYWKKDDDTDINSYEEAVELRNFYRPYEHGHQEFADMFRTAIDYEPFMDFNNIHGKSSDEHSELLRTMPDPSSFMKSSIRQKYVEPLLSSL